MGALRDILGCKLDIQVLPVHNMITPSHFRFNTFISIFFLKTCLLLYIFHKKYKQKGTRIKEHCEFLLSSSSNVKWYSQYFLIFLLFFFSTIQMFVYTHVLHSSCQIKLITIKETNEQLLASS